MREQREYPRYHLRWNVALLGSENGRPLALNGRTHDLSEDGASILLPINPALGQRVTAMLAPPPLHPGHHPALIEVDSRVVYVLFAPRHDAFRLGLQFLDFRGAGRDALLQRLAKHLPGFSQPRDLTSLV